MANTKKMNGKQKLTALYKAAKQTEYYMYYESGSSLGLSVDKGLRSVMVEIEIVGNDLDALVSATVDGELKTYANDEAVSGKELRAAIYEAAEEINLPKSRAKAFIAFLDSVRG